MTLETAMQRIADLEGDVLALAGRLGALAQVLDQRGSEPLQLHRVSE